MDSDEYEACLIKLTRDIKIIKATLDAISQELDKLWKNHKGFR